MFLALLICLITLFLPVLLINYLPRSVSAVGVRVASRRSLRGELHDAPGDCCLQLLDPLDAPGDSFRTAKSHSISTASCLMLLENNMDYDELLFINMEDHTHRILAGNDHVSM